MRDPGDIDDRNVDTCDHCDAPHMLDDLCPVPKSTDNSQYLWVCPDCYDEVCDEEGYDPQDVSSITKED